MAATPPFISLSHRYQVHKAAQPKWPELTDGVATLTVATSMVITSFSSLFGMAPIFIYYALWFSRARFKGVSALTINKDNLSAVLFAALLLLSTLWSAARSTTLYVGLEFASTIACGMIMSRVIPLRSLIKGIAWASSIILLITIASGRYTGDPFSSRYALTGYFGSKNVVGFFADIALIAGSSLSFFSKKGFRERGLGLVAIGIGAWAMIECRSSTSLLALMTVIAAYVLVRFIHFFHEKRRSALFVFVLSCGLFLAVVGLAMGWQAALFEASGRDATMTGRTYLWEQGLEIGMRKPILGNGSSAFWLPGNPDAERLWEKFDVHGGFHFHNTFIQLLVDLGVVGVALIAFIFLKNMILSTRVVLSRKLCAETVFFFSLSVLFITRSIAEIDVYGVFGLLGMVFYMTPVLLSAPKMEDVE